MTLCGDTVAHHGDEMVNLARNQGKAERDEHPLNRIVTVAKASDELVIKTTDVHLARRIGEAVKRAFHGHADDQYEEDGSFVRVNWRSDA